MRKCLFAGVALVLAVLVAGCGGSKGRSGGTASNGGAGSSKRYAELHWGMMEFPGDIDWIKNDWNQVGNMEALVTQSLVEMEPNGKPKLGVASYVERPNPTTYVYGIKSGVKFSDGKSLTAADVVYSLHRAVDGKESVVKSYLEDVASISARGDSAVVVGLKRPDANLPYALAFASQIIEKSEIQRVGEKAVGTPSALPIGTGPWKLDSYTPTVGAQLSLNPYWNGPTQPAAKIDFTLFKNEGAMALALRSGAIEGASNYTLPKLFANIPDTTLLKSPPQWYNFFSMNTKVAPFNDVHVRRAIAYAVDDGGIIKALYPSGLASEEATIVPSSIFGAFSSTQVREVLGMVPKYNFNLALAKRELTRSAYPHGFTTEIQAIATEPVCVDVAQIIASELAKIGITAKVSPVQPDEYAGLLDSKLKLYVNESGIPYGAPEAVLEELFSPAQIFPQGAGTNWASYTNAEVDRLLPEERESTSPTRQLQLIGKILKITEVEEPYRILFAHGGLAALSTKYVFPSFSSYAQDFSPWALHVKLAH